MEKIKKIIRRFALILFIIMASLVPVPVFLKRKQGKFNDRNSIELIEIKKDNDKTERETKLHSEFKF